jgi:hypothetical protein
LSTSRNKFSFFWFAGFLFSAFLLFWPQSIQADWSCTSQGGYWNCPGGYYDCGTVYGNNGCSGSRTYSDDFYYYCSGGSICGKCVNRSYLENCNDYDSYYCSPSGSGGYRKKYDWYCSYGSCTYEILTPKNCGTDYSKGYYCDQGRYQREKIQRQGCSSSNNDCYDFEEDAYRGDCGGVYSEWRCNGNLSQYRNINTCSNGSCGNYPTDWITSPPGGCGGSGWTDNYQCSGSTRQRQYRFQGCSGQGNCYGPNFQWFDWEYNSPSCDATPPWVSIFSPGSRPWANVDASVSVSYSDDNTGVSYTRHCWTLGSGCDPGTSNSSTFNNGDSLSQANNGSWTLCTRARDGANNWSSPYCRGPYQVDKINPSPAVISPPAGSLQTTNFTVTAVFSDSGGSGSQRCYYRTADNAADNYTTGWISLPCSGSQQFTMTVGPGKNCSTQGRDKCWVHLGAYDSAGNWGTGNRAFSVKPELTYPENYWQRIWYTSSGELLGEDAAKNESRAQFTNDWLLGELAFNRNDNIQFVSGRTIPFAAGTYRFTLDADDYTKFRVKDRNNNLIFNSGGWASGQKIYEVSLPVSDNYHLEIDYAEATAFARVSFRNSITCTGNVSLTLNPEATVFHSTVNLTAAGLSNCWGKNVVFSTNENCASAAASCQIPEAGTGCAASLTLDDARFLALPETTVNYYACVNKNDISGFNEPGETSEAKALTVYNSAVICMDERFPLSPSNRCLPALKILTGLSTNSWVGVIAQNPQFGDLSLGTPTHACNDGTVKCELKSISEANNGASCHLIDACSPGPISLPRFGTFSGNWDASQTQCVLCDNKGVQTKRIVNRLPDGTGEACFELRDNASCQQNNWFELACARTEALGVGKCESGCGAALACDEKTPLVDTWLEGSTTYWCNADCQKAEKIPPSSKIKSPDPRLWYSTDFSFDVEDTDYSSQGLDRCYYRVFDIDNNKWSDTRERPCYPDHVLPAVSIGPGASNDCRKQGKDRCLLVVWACDKTGNCKDPLTKPGDQDSNETTSPYGNYINYNIDYTAPQINQ